MLYEVAVATAGHVIVAAPAPGAPVTPVGAEGAGGMEEAGVAVTWTDSWLSRPFTTTVTTK